jgi:hypothetical protein
MTFQEWFAQLTDPLSLLTETIYNLLFEIAATYVFVRLYMKKHVANEVKRLLEEEKEKDSKK